MTNLDSPVPKKVTDRPVLRPHRNVLVVEDDKDTATVICYQLMQDGYGVRQVATRDEALNVLDTYMYDYIIMDYWMPGMDAKEFVRKVTAKRPNTRIILSTAARDIGHIGTELGLFCCLPKPIIPEQVAKILQQFDEE
jgi:CheY-like chemotaxis protein